MPTGTLISLELHSTRKCFFGTGLSHFLHIYIHAHSTVIILLVTTMHTDDSVLILKGVNITKYLFY